MLLCVCADVKMWVFYFLSALSPDELSSLPRNSWKNTHTTPRKNLDSSEQVTDGCNQHFLEPHVKVVTVVVVRTDEDVYLVFVPWVHVAPLIRR